MLGIICAEMLNDITNKNVPNKRPKGAKGR